MESFITKLVIRDIMKFLVQLTNEHLNRNSKIKDYEALNEIIWNAIDADSYNISITFLKQNEIIHDKVTSVIIKDDGIGLNYNRVEEVLKPYGRSEKSNCTLSPNGRQYHGKLGEGRYTYFSIGNKVQWKSTYENDGKFMTYYIDFDSHVPKVNVGDEIISTDCKSGMEVLISNINEDTSYNFSQTENLESSIIKEFAPYLTAYKNIIVSLNGKKIDFSKEINVQKVYTKSINNIQFKLTIVRWNSIKSNEIFYCGKGNVVYFHEESDYFTNNCTVYLESEYFDELKLEGKIELMNFDYLHDDIVKFISESFESFKADNEVSLNQAFIDELKKQDIYPYMNEPTTFEEKEQKDIFDVVAIHLNKVAPKINTSNKITRKLTYNLINEAIKTNPSSLKKILSEVFKLTKEQQDDFAKLLDDTSMACIISTMQEVTDRLYFLDELSNLVYGDVGKHVKERTQFQKLLLSQIWIFGDQYKYGVDDISLRNVLKEYIKELGLADIELTKEDYENTDLNKIPDIILWRNNKFGDKFENLVVEIKRPTKIIDNEEVTQIKKYAQTVSSDERFSQNKCKWRFIIIGKCISEYIKNELRSTKNNRFDYGNYCVEVMTWGELINDNKLKYEYFKKSTQLHLTEGKVNESLKNRWKKLLGDRAPM